MSLPVYQFCEDGVDHSFYLIYHGTSSEAALGILRNGLRPSRKGMLGPGIYCSAQFAKVVYCDKLLLKLVTIFFCQAIRYPLNHDDDDRVVLRLLVYTGKVYRCTKQKDPNRKRWQEMGFDTCWVPQNSYR